MVCKFFTWPHFCILCGNTLEASGRLGSYPVRAVKITKRWLRRTTDRTTKSVKKPFSWRLINWLDSRTQQPLTLRTQLLLLLLLPLPLLPFLFRWLAIWLRHIEVRVRSNMQSSRATWSWHSFKCVINLCCAGKCEWGKTGGGGGEGEVILELSAFSSRFVLVSLCAPPVSGTFGLSIQSIKSTSRGWCYHGLLAISNE